MITAPESLPRVQLKVECYDQSKGANALGSDHHLLFVEWKVSAVISEERNQQDTIRDYSKLQEPETLQAFQSALSGEMSAWQPLPTVFEVLALETETLSESALALQLDQLYSLLTEHIQKAIAATIPSKVVGPNCRSWWDEEIQNLGNIRSEAYIALRSVFRFTWQCTCHPR